MKDLKNILIILAVAIISLMLYLILPMANNDDTYFHVVNTLELKETFSDNLFYGNRIVGDIANDFGYGTRLFYPPLGHTSVAYIDLVFDNIEISFKFFNVLILFLSGVTLYYLSKKISKDKKVALLSAIIYMTFSYHLSDIIIRDALAETLVFVFIPLILNAIYSLFYESGKNFYLLFVVGYVGGILSHTTMMMYFTFLIFIFLLLNIKKLFTKEIFFKLIIGSLFILSITSFFWVSMLEQSIHGFYRVFEEGVMVQGTQFNGLFNYEFVNQLDNFGRDIRYFIDIVVIVLLILTMIKYKKIDNKFYLYVFILGCISLFMSTVLFPWDIFPKSLRMIQFPWRMMTYACLFISLFAPLYFKNSKSKTYYLVIVIILAGTIFNFRTRVNDDYFKEVNFNNLNYEVAMGWQKEYLPVNTYTNIDYYNNRSKEIIALSGEVTLINNETPYLEFSVNEAGIFEMPRLYYYGYVLRDSSGEKVDIYENENGFIEANLDIDTYTLSYEGSNSLKVANVVSILSLIVFGGLLWKKLV